MEPVLEGTVWYMSAESFFIGFFNGDLFTVIKVVRGFTGPHISHM